MSQHKRGKFLIDRSVQLGVVRTIVFQWFVFLVAAAVCLPLIRAIVLVDYATPLSERVAAAAVDTLILFGLFAALLPYIVFDTFKITNRFAGPIYRLHANFRSIASGVPFKPIRLRKHDWWGNVAEDFNVMVARLQNDAASRAQDRADEEEPAAV